MSGQRISYERLAHDVIDARAEIARLTASYESRLADAYQAAGALIHAMGLSDNADCIRLQDVLAYGKTEDGVDLLPWPRDPEALARDSDIARLTAERDEALDRATKATTANSILNTGLANLQSRYDSLADDRNDVIARNLKLNSEIAALQSRYDALLAERAGVSEAMVEAAGLAVCRAHNCGLSLKGALVLCDDPRLPDDVRGTGLCGRTCDCREGARIGLEAALATPIQPASPPPDWDDIRGVAPHATGGLSSEDFVRELRDDWDATPIPTPVDREAIRAEAFEEAAKITKTAPSLYAVATACLTRAVELRRSAAKTGASR